MSEAIGEYRLVEQAFGRPTLRLLNGKGALVQVCVAPRFDRDRRSVPTERVHADIDEILAILREVGVDTPTGTGRA